MSQILVEHLTKLDFKPGEVLVVRVPDDTSPEEKALKFDHVVGCIRCLPKDKAPQGVLFLPNWVQLDQLQAETLSPDIRQTLGLLSQQDRSCNP